MSVFNCILRFSLEVGHVDICCVDFVAFKRSRGLIRPSAGPYRFSIGCPPNALNGHLEASA